MIRAYTLMRQGEDDTDPLTEAESDAAYTPATHTADADPHSQYLTAAEGAAAFDAIGSAAAAEAAALAAIAALPTLAWGTWSPTTTNVTNMDSSTPFEGQYLRVGNTVHCTVRVTVDCTAAAPTLSQFDIDLPIASNLGAVEDLCGAGAITYAASHAACRIQADVANNRAAITFHAQATTAANGTFSFSYQVL